MNGRRWRRLKHGCPVDTREERMSFHLSECGALCGVDALQNRKEKRGPVRQCKIENAVIVAKTHKHPIDEIACCG
jgi:hypothetical protein